MSMRGVAVVAALAAAGSVFADTHNVADGATDTLSGVTSSRSGLKSVTGPMPLLPFLTLFHAWSALLPTGETHPIPVITTRRLAIYSSAKFAKVRKR